MLEIFLTNLGKYNEGILQGEWVKLPISEDDLKEVLERIGINERYEETFITDFESDIDGLHIDEFDSISELNELAEKLVALDEWEAEIVGALLSDGYSVEDALEKYEDCIVYHDCYSMTDVAEQYCEECGILDSVPEDLRNYFDFEAFGRDMSFEGHYIFTNGGKCVQVCY